MELVDMRDLGSRAFSVWVRVPSGAPKQKDILMGVLFVLDSAQNAFMVRKRSFLQIKY
jgi:hypothetical protein